HHAHAIGMASIHRLKVAMIKRILPEHCNHAADELLVRNRAVSLDPLSGVLIVFASETHDDMGDRTAEQLVFGFAAFFQSLHSSQSFFFKAISFSAEAVRFLVVKRSHVGLRDGSGSAQNALLATTRAG